MNNNYVTTDNDAALKTIDIQQAVIARMAATSATTKNWCVTLVAAVSVAAIEKSNWVYGLLAIFATALFLVTDSYYLALERNTRKSHDAFAEKLRSGTATSSDLFDVGSTAVGFFDTAHAVLSWSIWPFYLLIIFALSIATCLLRWV